MTRSIRRDAFLGQLVAAILGLFVVFVSVARASSPSIEFYTRPGCPRCAEARHFIRELAKERPDISVIEQDVSQSRHALERLRGLADRAGVTAPGVPAFVFGDAVLVGFDPKLTPPRFRALLEGASGSTGGVCDVEPSHCEGLPPPPGSIDLPVVGKIDANRLGLPLFTLAVGLVDGFNPCATWVLLFLLAMLVNLKSRSRMALIAGTFVLVSGIVYFAFMAAWLTFFMVVGISRPITVVLAVLALLIGAVNVKDFFALGRGPSLGIPESAKPGFYARIRAILKADNLAGAMTGIVVLAFLVNLVELLCTAGLPALYTAILTSHGLSTWSYYAYLALYIVAYMLDDAVLVSIGVVTLGRRKLQERGGRWLKLISGLLVLGLGALLLLRPGWLGF